MVLGSAVSVFLKDRIHSTFRARGEMKLGLIGIIAASALRFASPLYMYGTIPLAASFSKSGIRDDWRAAFMMSSIFLNPQLIIYSAALGSQALIIRVVSCFLCGVAAGLLIRFFIKTNRSLISAALTNRQAGTSIQISCFALSATLAGISGRQEYIFCLVFCYRYCFSDMFRQKLWQRCLAGTK